MSKAEIGATNRIVLPVRYQGAGWTCQGAQRLPDMADFGPRVTVVEPLARTPLPLSKPKPVQYLPVPRRGGKELFPDLQLQLAVVEPGVRGQNAVPKKWDGAEVLVEVINLYKGQELFSSSASVKGKLRDGFCVIRIPADVVERWFTMESSDQKTREEQRRRASQGWAAGDSSGTGGMLNARVNENLLDFTFKIPAISISGQPFAGSSQNRLFLYRRKVIVFYPGVFGSQVHVKTRDGQILGFPDYRGDDAGSAEARSVTGKLPPPAPQAQWTADAGERLVRMLLPIQTVGALECDSAGKPLAEALSPKLVMMHLVNAPGVGSALPKVYDTYRCCHDAAHEHYRHLPPGFRLVTLITRPYDWRKDLTETAMDCLKYLRWLQKDSELGALAPDSDDQVAVIGHSTGGVIIRRMLAEQEARNLISHAFFMNVPFRGSPKTFPVIAAGRDPLDGEPMIPCCNPRSLRAMALTAPIVYHLSVSSFHRTPVFVRPEQGPSNRLAGLEGVKAWTQLGIEKGFFPSRKVIPASAPLSKEERERIAFAADAWNDYWERRFEEARERALPGPLGGTEKDGQRFAPAPPSELVAQDRVRVEQGWSDELASRAEQFHAKCEEMAQSREWADRAYIFYSVSKKPTTMRAEAKLLSSKEYSLPDFVRAAMRRESAKRCREAIPSGTPVEVRDDATGEKMLLWEHGAFEVDHWIRKESAIVWERWRFATLDQVAGDSTVPLWSLLGFGGEAQVFKRLVEDEESGAGPLHSAAPNSSWAWARIMNVIQGWDVSYHLAPRGNEGVDPVLGTDGDKRIRRLQEHYRGPGA